MWVIGWLATARRGVTIATCTATNPPMRIDRTTGAGGKDRITPSTCSTILVIVRLEKSGSLKSGECSWMPRSRNFAARYVPLVDRAEEAKPWR